MTQNNAQQNIEQLQNPTMRETKTQTNKANSSFTT